ncbi:sugar transferase [Faecalicatena contorta]|uniref:Exopolysaccharide biosynthesis polyprenyl glycosylphosphotransferase n=1 Tax=Faecalicatena contorta TaxID=39482 RepID=A0A316A1U1_9FIRM|nr:sugar transferase [Faecalicatena contorta]PWJ51553.1 exopolysaccharide biosynthesis polyprenyl glycosylphosphotransferase [Faecalicatena contorta]SUQ13109.1 exopolysaccharide biosynthesis polyprenyl glycosylphosphotransferase [Faecalicatena contorta]
MYQNIVKGWTKHLDFMILDILCLEGAFLISYIIRNGSLENGLSTHYQYMIWAIIVANILAVFFMNSYEDIIRRGYMVEIKRTLSHCGFVTLGLIVWMFSFKESSSYSRLVVLGMYPVSVFIVLVVRLFWKRVIRMRIRGKKKMRRVLIISTEGRIEDTIEGLLQPYRDYQLNACILYDTSDKVGTEIKYVPVVADKEHMIQYIQDNIIDEVFIDLPEYEKQAERLMGVFVGMGLIAHVNLARFTPSAENKMIQRFAGFMVLSSGMKFATPRQLFCKRFLDICGALVGLAATGIAFLIFAPIIKKQSPGPVFFSQERVGRNGRHFKIYKFRTMYPDAEERKKELMAQNKMNGLMFKMDNDPRIIPIGHFLRKSSIDEFPQFWNVLKGDMSLVGTRPPTVDEYEQYELRHRKRLAMRPGLTGMWQVSGRSNIVDFEEVVTLDAKYIAEWTLGLDLKIIGRTVLIVLGQEGAA